MLKANGTHGVFRAPEEDDLDNKKRGEMNSSANFLVSTRT